MNKIFLAEITFEISSKAKVKVKGKTAKVASKTRRNVAIFKCNIVWSK